MSKKEGKQENLWVMAIVVILIFLAVAAMILGFHMIQKRQEEKLLTAEDAQSTQNQVQTRSQKEKEAAKGTSQQEAETDTQENEDTIGTFGEDGEEEKIYLIQGDAKSSNRYEKVAHLSYTSTVKYTIEDLKLLDSSGLKITKNEIFARHGRMFNNQELQEYFERQKWYVAQITANDFDDSCLNEVESYNVDLISSYEKQLGLSGDSIY